MKIEFARQYVEVAYLEALVGVRYWEDAKVNGIEDEKGDLIPCRNDDVWHIHIDLETGIIRDWPVGVVADVYYKVCDAGTYRLLSPSGDVIIEKNGYVPKIMCPGDSGYGDYVIMKIDGDGRIDKWRVDLNEREWAIYDEDISWR